MTSPITVVGIGDDGCIGLSSRAFNAIKQSTVLFGGERVLDFFPEYSGSKVVIKDGIKKTIAQIEDYANEHTVVVLASGDPLFFGIGGLLAKKISTEMIQFLPQVSSMQLAFAAIGQSWQDAQIESVHGRDLAGLANRVRQANKVAILTDADNNPQVIAQHILTYGQQDWQAAVCENLASADEKVTLLSVQDLAKSAPEWCNLNVLLLWRNNVPTTVAIPYDREAAFAKRIPKQGLITKREVRVLSLAAMQIHSKSIVWDIGAASGSVGIEAAKLAKQGKVYALEVNSESVEHCIANAIEHGVDNLNTIAGLAEEMLETIPDDPDAVFIGGSKGALQPIVEASYARLSPGGMIVSNTITLESQVEAYKVFRQIEAEQGAQLDISLIQISRAEPLAHYLRYQALNPIHIFALQKPQLNESI